MVAIHEHGFVVHRGKREITFPWNSIKCVSENRKAEGIPLATGVGGALAKKVGSKTARSYTVVRSDDELFFFDDNIISRGSLLAGPLRTAQIEHGFKWNVCAT